MARRTRRPLNVVSLNCKSCGTRLERQELRDGECFFCQAREFGAEVEALEQAADEELATIEQEQLWG